MVNEALLLVDHGRPSLNSFRRAGLPEAGLNIDYPAVSANTIATDEQAAQGDTLTFGKLSLQTKTTPVLTIGGWTDVSRQTIERSSVAYLSEVFRAMSLAYGKETNARFIENLEAGTYDESVGTAGTAVGVTGAVADASISLYENAGVRPQFILASSDVWKTLVTLFAEDGRPIIGGSAPVNNIGTSNLPGMTANVFGLEVIRPCPTRRQFLHRKQQRHHHLGKWRCSLPSFRRGHHQPNQPVFHLRLHRLRHRLPRDGLQGQLGVRD